MGEWESHHTAVTSLDLPRNPQRPANADDAAESIRKFIIQLFMREDGDGVDWSRRSSPARCSSWRSGRLTGCRAVNVVIGCYTGSRCAPMTVLRSVRRKSMSRAGLHRPRRRLTVWKGRKRISATRCNRAGCRSGAVYGPRPNFGTLRSIPSPPAPAGRDSR